MNLKRVLTVTKKEFIHIRRDKASMILALVAPVMMLLLFGFAVSTDVNDIRLAVCDQSNTMESRELIRSYENSAYFKVYTMTDNPQKAEKMIAAGNVKAALLIPTDFAKGLRRGEKEEVQILVDGSDPSIARTAANYAVMISNGYSLKVSSVKLMNTAAALNKSPGVDARAMIMYNPTLESSKFNVPGVVGLILQNITVILTAFAMVREREKGTIEQLIMTPVSSLELIIGKLIPYVFIGIYDYAIVLLLSYILFGVAIKGSILLLTLLGIIFLIGALAMGMLISTFAKTQLQAMQASLLVLLPSVLLSGFMFPREAMPKVVYAISTILPVTHFLIILRGIILKGVGISYLYKTAAVLLALIIAIIAITVKKFTKKLD
ncbi:MAG: transporter permease [Clostridia bacterium]|jgi:ABC-2 type transport system permease protein|nr:transporter permease [Clostridia bacterium]